MGLRKFTQDGQSYVEIPDEFWKCPKCGVGYNDGDGLVDDDDVRENTEEGIYFSDTELVCYTCNGNFDAKQVYAKAIKKADLVQCSCCLGQGTVKKAKAEKEKRLTATISQLEARIKELEETF